MASALPYQRPAVATLAARLVEPRRVLMKLRASRLTDTAELARMLGHQAEPDLDEVRADLESIISLGRLEYEPE